MKKLLIITLVLLTATMASAGLSLTAGTMPGGGEIMLWPSDSWVFGVKAAPGFGLGDYQISLSNAQGSLDASGVVFSQEYTTMYIPAYGPITQPWGLEWANVGNLQDDAQHFSLGGGNLPPTVTLYDEIIMQGLVFHLDEETEVIITLEEYLGGGQYQLLDTLTVRQVPEPATLLLLGLGFSLIRKRTL